jgi:protein-S-isoprenylcysteine O-methyltransferase Ste14
MFWIFLSVIFWGLLHSLLASHKAKGITRRWLGEKAARFYRLAYNIFACVSFLPVLVIVALTPDRTLYLVPMPWSALMVAGQFLAVIGLVLGFRQTDAWEFLGLRQIAGVALSRRVEPVETLSKGPMETRQGRLVTNGLYHYVRHPLYSAGLAFIWLMPLVTVNLLAINVALTIYVIVGAIFEERKLRREFGQEYSDYAAVTPMLIPFTKRNKARRESSL